MTAYAPVKELVNLVGSGLRLDPHLLIIIVQGLLDQRFHRSFVEQAEPPGKMAQRHDRVPAHAWVRMCCQAYADRHGEIRVRERQCNGHRDEEQLIGRIPGYGSFDISCIELRKVLELPGHLLNISKKIRYVKKYKWLADNKLQAAGCMSRFSVLLAGNLYLIYEGSRRF